MYRIIDVTIIGTRIKMQNIETVTRKVCAKMITVDELCPYII